MRRGLDVRPPSSRGGASPSDTVTGPDAFGDDAAPGTAAEYSRGDHNHGLPDGAGLPDNFLTGEGSPIGSVVPPGPALYLDTTSGDDNTGLWASYYPYANNDWATLGGGSGINPGAVRGYLAYYDALSTTGSRPLQLVNDEGQFGFSPTTTTNVYSYAGDPNGHVSPNAEGDLCVDTTTPGLWQSSDGTETGWIQFAAGGSGGVASLSGAGVDTSPGLLVQAGGLHISDTDGDGITGETASANGLLLGAQGPPGGSFGVNLFSNGTGYYFGIAGSAGNAIVGSLITSLPLTVTTGVNDELVYTPVATGTPETFTVAPGVYTTMDELTAALNSASGTSSDVLGDYVNCNGGGRSNFSGVTYTSYLVFNGAPSNTAVAGDTISAGANDLLADIGFAAGPYTFAWTTDTLAFFTGQGGGATQKTLTGALSAVTDPAAKALLTSLLAALGPAGYNLVLDGTT